MKEIQLFGRVILCSVFFASGLMAQKFTYNTVVDSVKREYIVHVPSTYDSSKKVPVVFMLHGTSGDGELMYATSGWVEMSNKEGFIAVFPSSLRYRIIDNGEYKTITKWNTQPDADWDFQSGENPKDDVKFLRKVLQEVSTKYSIDVHRVYLNGFSNGGSMAAKCSIEMSDVLAAVCSNASAFFTDTFYTPKRKIPYLFEVGNLDYGPGNVGPEYPPVPMNLFDTLISTPGLKYLNGKHFRIANNCIRNFSLKSEHSKIVGDTNFALLTTYYPEDPKDTHEFKYIFVKNLGHGYPNWAPVKHWEWLQQFTLIDSSANVKGRKIRRVTKVQDVDREYFIHVPANYDSTTTVPMVVFFHGSGQDGNLFYNISGWNEVADTQNFIVVYPSALNYCVLENGVQKMSTKFVVYPQSGDPLCEGQELKDDVLFVKTILEQVSKEFPVDPRRIYTVGFSNGGEMATRCGLEMGDKIAASIGVGGGGSLPVDTVLIPKRKLPVMNMFGNMDQHILDGLGINDKSVPMGFGPLYTKYPQLYGKQVVPYINAFDLESSNYQTIGDTNNVVAAILKGKVNDPLNVFYLVEVKNMEHEYPNGINHPLHAATYHWSWLKRYSLPDLGGVIDNTLKNNIRPLFYPNPAKDIVLFSDLTHYRISSLGGVILKQGVDKSVTLEDLPEGGYILDADNHAGILVISR
ncbi:MAG: hypothetical protein K1X68_11545 [Saprospiraceae bacterium]|nr:hypothetical protein [Saprospiraceae bacterium]